MGWSAAGEGRWNLDDGGDDRHVLLQVGEFYFEVHGDTMHVYRGPAEVADERWPLGDPETADLDRPERNPVQHVETFEHAFGDVDDDGLWPELEGYAEGWVQRSPGGGA